MLKTLLHLIKAHNPEFTNFTILSVTNDTLIIRCYIDMRIVKKCIVDNSIQPIFLLLNSMKNNLRDKVIPGGYKLTGKLDFFIPENRSDLEIRMVLKKELENNF